jgi:hypothetical protein
LTGPPGKPESQPEVSSPELPLSFRELRKPSGRHRLHSTQAESFHTEPRLDASTFDLPGLSRRASSSLPVQPKASASAIDPRTERFVARPPRSSTIDRGRTLPLATEPNTTENGSSHEVPSPTAFSPLEAAAFRGPGFPRPAACAFRFSQPLDASIRPEPAGLVSCQIRSWGSPFRALLLPCSRSPSPASLPS